jgi:cation transport regulator ChaC
MLYLAYGSNMNSHQMKVERCKNARFIGTGFLQGYEFVFDGSNLKGSKVADIRVCQGGIVPYVLWEVNSQENLNELNKSEGYPKHYTTIEITVNIDGNNVLATAYVMTDYKKSLHSSSISPEYIEKICSGLVEHDLPTLYLDNAIKKASV